MILFCIILVFVVLSIWYLYSYKIDIVPIIEQLKEINIRVIDKNNSEELKTKRDYDIVVNDKTFYDDVLNNGTLGLGESYMNKKWDCDKLDELFDKILWNKFDEKIKFNNYFDYIKLFSSYFFNQQTKEKSYEVEDTHYNLDNNLYKNMLGETMAYSCAYWKNANNLDEAQLNKFELICQKLKLKKDDYVLDIGSGFGGLVKYMAEKYGCNVTGINISTEQLKYARESCKELIDNYQVKFIDCDYRDIPLLKENRKYDKIVSVGAFEHIGYKNYRTIMEKCNDLLANDGLFYLHTIGGNQSVTKADPWIDKYIFPNGMLPSIKQVGESCEGLFVIEDLHNFGSNYDKTLMAWYDNYINSIKSGKIKHNDKFYRMWTYYLLQCAGTFRSRTIQLWQFVLTKQYKGIYKCVR